MDNPNRQRYIDGVLFVVSEIRKILESDNL